MFLSHAQGLTVSWWQRGSKNLRLIRGQAFEGDLLVSCRGYEQKLGEYLRFLTDKMAVVPVRTCKLNPPRPVLMTETRESLANWFEGCRNFLANDDHYVRFTLPGATWDPDANNFGFLNEGQETKLRRPAAEVAAALERMWTTISGFFPFSFLRRRFTSSTSWNSMRQIVFVIFNFQLNGHSLLDSLTGAAIKMAEDENLYIFYERILDFFTEHLVGPNVNAGGFQTGPHGDNMSLSQNNLIVLLWLQKIDPRLPKLVQVEYGAELRANTQLVDLVSRIANDIPALLEKNKNTRDIGVARVYRDEEYEEELAHIQRFRDNGRGGNTSRGRGNGRNGRGGSGRGGGARTDERSQLHCSHCKHLARELGIHVPADHSPLTCRRRRVHVRGVTGQQYEDGEDEEIYGDARGFSDEGQGDTQPHPPLPSDPLSLQTESEIQTSAVAVDPGGASFKSLLARITCGSYPGPSTAITLSIFSDLSELDIAAVRRVITRFRTPTRADSPALLANYRGRDMKSVVDSGAELNCLDLQLVKDMRVPYLPTTSGAKAVGEIRIDIAGVTSADFVIYSDFNGRKIPINLQRAVVVDALGVDAIIGEPAKQFNGLETNARTKRVSIRYEGSVLSKPYLDISRRVYRVAKPDSATTVFPGEKLRVPVPAGLEREDVLLYSTRRDGPTGLLPGFALVQDGHVSLQNSSQTPVTVSSKKPIGELRACSEIKIPYSSPRASRVSASSFKKQVTLPSHRGLPRYQDLHYSSHGEAETGFPGQKQVSVERQVGVEKRLGVDDEKHPGISTITGQAQVDSGGSQDSRSGRAWKPCKTSSETWSPHSSPCSRDSGYRSYAVPGPAGSETEPSAGSEKASSHKEKTVENEERAESQEQSIAGVVSYPSSGFKYATWSKSSPITNRDPDIVVDPDKVLTESEREQFRQVSREFYDIFTKSPGKYNGYSGRVCNAIQFASEPTPNMKVYLPSYSDKQLEEMGRLMDQLVEYGVLQRPEDVGVTPVRVSPSFLVPKNEIGEYRLVTDMSGLNKHIVKFPSISPTINEARNALARSKYFVHLDLSNYFFQCGVDREDSQYLATFHPQKGLLVYVVTPQGLKNASEQGYEILARVFGDMVEEGRLTRQADSLFPLGNTVAEVLTNYEETLRRAKLNGLTFKPGKVIVCPTQLVLFGWQLKDSRWTPTEHTTSSLSIAPLPTTVNKLRSFLGSLKQYTECVPKYAVLLHELEKMVGGRGSSEKLTWSDEQKAVFYRARRASTDITAVTVPRPDDKLETFSDFSADARAVGGRLEIIRQENGKETRYHGGFFSVVLDKYKAHWVPCEAEAAGVRLTLQHFEPYIRENRNITVHYTDNMPTVQAWRRCLQGKFSASSRISTFLVGLSALSVELVYRPGKDMALADHGSRNPVPCPESEKCQICIFAGEWQDKGDFSSKIGSVTVKDVMEGRSLMPYIQKKTWLGLQLSDPVHVKFRRLVETGQHPEKKKTCGDFTIIKQLYSRYQSGDVHIQPDGLILVKVKDGYFNGFAISVPRGLLSGIAFSIHIKLGHPSKGQLLSLMARYFYCHGHIGIIHSVVDNCVQCRSLQPVPKQFTLDTTEKVQGLGTQFAVDVIERFGQKILLTREKLSQTTWLELIPDQTTATFRKAIFKTVLPWAHPAGATVRCDGAAALASLAKETESQGSVFKEFNIKLEVGRPHNVNKNAVAENAIREAEKEILKYRPSSKALTDEDLTVIAKLMNDRVRNRGVTAKEILTKRDCVTNEDKKIDDKLLSDQQFDQRLDCNTRAKGRKPEPQLDEDFHVGDIVYIRNQLSKHQPREQFIVVKFVSDMVVIQKLHSRFGSKEYTLFKDELMSASTERDELFDQTSALTNSADQELDQAQEQQDSVEASPPLDTTKPKRGRGRPRKTASTEKPITGVEDIHPPRPERVAASRARQAWRSNPDIQRVTQPILSRKNRNTVSSLYITAFDSNVPQTESVSTYWQTIPDQYWWFPPDGNYGWLEDDDWVMPDLDAWGEGDLVPADHPPDVVQAIQQFPDDNIIDVGFGSSQSEDNLSQSEDDFESAEGTPDGARASSNKKKKLPFAGRLRQLARNPDTADQVNMARVVNLDDVLVQDGSPNNQVRRSQRRRKKPPRYQN